MVSVMDSQILLAILIITVAFGGEAIFGFGGGLIAIPLLSLSLGVRDAVTLALLFQVAMGVLIFKTYRDINWKVAKPITGGLIVGTIAGTLFLSKANTTFLQLFMALAILTFLIKMIWFKSLVIRDIHNKAWTSGSGLAAGLSQGLIGIGGPILAMYLSVATPKKAQFRATTIYLLFMICVVRLVISVPQGLYTQRIIEIALWTVPLFIAAIAAGQLLHHKIKEEYYRVAIYIILFGAAGSLLVKALN